MEEEKAEKEKKEKSLDITNKLRENPWIISTIVLGLFVIITLFFLFKGGITGNVISEKDIGTNALTFFNTQLSQTPGTLDSVNLKNGIYEVNINSGGNVFPVYFTKDGSFIVQGNGLIPITGNAIDNTQTQEQPTQKEIPKSDKPVVELFIMTHCPYGTQAEKGIIPVIKALGNKIDAKIEFVHYFMHGDKEEQETYRQLCIRETQSSKFISYLECFLEDSNAQRCLTKLGINVDSCILGKAKDYYAADSALSQQYGVQGSPTLIINGVEAQSARDPASLLDTICSAFNTAPAECSQQLSTATPDPGFGVTSSGNAADSASCG